MSSFLSTHVMASAQHGSNRHRARSAGQAVDLQLGDRVLLLATNTSVSVQLDTIDKETIDRCKASFLGCTPSDVDPHSRTTCERLHCQHSKTMCSCGSGHACAGHRRLQCFCWSVLPALAKRRLQPR